MTSDRKKYMQLSHYYPFLVYLRLRLLMYSKVEKLFDERCG
jgi:hypothetical protein